MERIDELFNTKELLNYYRVKNLVPMLGDTLFPARKIQDIKLDMITGANGLPVSASINAFDTETQLASKEALQKGAADLSLVKRKIAIGEKDIIAINNHRMDSEQKELVMELFKYGDKMVSAVQTRIEAMRMELLSSGKISINENGVAITLDYSVPKSNIKNFNWSDPATAKPLEDIRVIADAVEETSGTKPTRILTSTKVLNKILMCESVRKAIFGVSFDRMATRNDLNTLLDGMELPQIAVYNAKYKIQVKGGKYTTKRYFPENALSVFAENQLGESIYGLTAEEIELIGAKNMEEAKMVGNIFVGVEKQGDPVKRFTKASATCLPTLENGLELGIATIS